MPVAFDIYLKTNNIDKFIKIRKSIIDIYIRRTNAQPKVSL